MKNTVVRHDSEPGALPWCPTAIEPGRGTEATSAGPRLGVIAAITAVGLFACAEPVGRVPPGNPGRVEAAWEILDEAADELLDDVEVEVIESSRTGFSREAVKAHAATILGSWERLHRAAQASFLEDPAAHRERVRRSVPCNECSDQHTACLSDAVDHLVDCVFECGTFGNACRRDCRAAWREERQECIEESHECRKSCTPK